MGDCLSVPGKDVSKNEAKKQEKELSSRESVKFTKSAKIHEVEGDRMINEYQIMKDLGKGSFSSVMLVCDESGKSYACKSVNKVRMKKIKGPSGKTVFENCMNEIEIYKLLKKGECDHVVGLYEVIDDPNHEYMYLILDYCHNGVLLDFEGLKTETTTTEKVQEINVENSLEEEDLESNKKNLLISSPEKTKKKPHFAMKKIKGWMNGVVKGLEYLHLHNVMHGDIKPNNILLDDEIVRIADFGTSIIYEKGKKIRNDIGTPKFLCPESIVGSDYFPPARDVWALGVTLFVLIFLEVPFQGNNLKELQDTVGTAEIKFPFETDDSTEDLLRKILDKKPESRITLEGMKKHEWFSE